MAHAQQHYYVPHASRYSVLLSVGIFLLAFGFILKLNAISVGLFSMLVGVAAIIFVLFGWFGAVIGENASGKYQIWEDRSFRLGMIWFIFSEVMFFAAFFGVLFYYRVISVPELASFDPQFTPYPGFPAAWPSRGNRRDRHSSRWLRKGIPAINTLILLTSGATLTWAHWGWPALRPVCCPERPAQRCIASIALNSTHRLSLSGIYSEC